MILDALWNAQRKRRKLDKLYGRLISKAERGKNPEEVGSLGSEYRFERNLINDTINSLESSMIQERAERLGVPVPNYSPDHEAWEKGFQPNVVYLSLKTRAELRSQIRKERRERVEYWTLLVKDLIVPLVGLLVGLVGATIGLVSVLRSGK
jgi:hypothetical protein